jgi:hypothetical protein
MPLYHTTMSDARRERTISKPGVFNCDRFSGPTTWSLYDLFFHAVTIKLIVPPVRVPTAL